MDWIERAERQIEEAYERGVMTDKEYHKAMQDLAAEVREAAADAAEQAYNDFMF